MTTFGYIHQTESFGAVDGPGIRYVVFMQGCDMRCRYCHNPETWHIVKDDNECDGKWDYSMKTPEEVLNAALRYKAYWKNEGGITVSGGEALLQIDFVIELFEKAKGKGINTCLDTSGHPFNMGKEFLGKFDRLCELTDLFLLDIKHIDDDAHKKLTGHTNSNILEMAKYLSDKNKPVWIRYVLVPSLTDDENDVKRLKGFIDTLSNVKKVEVLPYHNMGTYKYEELGLPYSLKDTKRPDKEVIKRTEKILGIIK